jgi:hypothetical protein
MVKTIYLIAGERLIEGVAHFGGLYANVGQTERSVSERLKDEDYRRKNSGGDWKVLKTWKVEPYVSDSDLHKILKSNKYAGKVMWKKSSNTEEFNFIGDDGKGSVAIPIIQEELERLSVFVELPAIKAANKALIQTNKELTKSNQILEINYKSVSKKLRDLVGGDILDENARLLGELEEEREEKTAAFLMLKEAMEELDALTTRLEASTKEKDDLEIGLKKSIFSYKESAALKIRSLAVLCVAALCFAWLVNTNANEELETLAIANEQQVEEMNLQLANVEKEKKTNLDKIAKLEEEAKKKVAKKKAKPKKQQEKELTQCKFFTKEGKNLICSSNGKHYKIHGSSFLEWNSGAYTGKTVKILKIGGERWYTTRGHHFNEQIKVIKIENL